MLKKRIIPLLLWSDGRLVKTVAMANPRVVGEPVRTCRVYSDQDADELVLLDISAGKERRAEFIEVIRRVSSSVMMPITAGGGVRFEEDAAGLFEAGADKVFINSAAYRDLDLIEAIAKTYGAQSIMVGIDHGQTSNRTVLFSQRGSTPEAIGLKDHIISAQSAGAGEILLQSVQREGTKVGLDLESLQTALEVSSLPLISSGGVGNFTHIREALERGAAGVACGTLFNYGDHNPIRAKAYLRNYGVALKTSQ